MCKEKQEQLFDDSEYEVDGAEEIAPIPGATVFIPWSRHHREVTND